jgi:hypothetical protein
MKGNGYCAATGLVKVKLSNACSWQPASGERLGRVAGSTLTSAVTTSARSPQPAGDPDDRTCQAAKFSTRGERSRVNGMTDSRRDRS